MNLKHKADNPSTNYFPLHLAQKEVYYDQLLYPNRSHYNIGCYIILKGQLNKECFSKALKSYPEVFDVFRMKFDFEQDEPLCYFPDEYPEIPIEQLDFSKQSKEEAVEWMQNRLNQAFRLKEEELYRFALLKISEEEHWWFLCTHHLINDGYGTSVITQYLANKYSALLAEEEAVDFDFEQYSTCLENSQAYLLSDTYKKDESYWHEQFTPAPASLFKPRYPLPAKQQSNRVNISISEERRKSWEGLMKQSGSNLQQLTLAALTIYYSSLRATSHITFGVSLHRRRSRRERNMAGMFSGIIPFKSTFDAEQSLQELIVQIKRQQRSDYRHQNYPISHVKRKLKTQGEHHQRLFDILVNYEPINFTLKMTGIENATMHLSSDEEYIPLQFRWCDYGEQQPLELNVDFQHTYFQAQEAELIVQRMLNILDQFPTQLDQPVSSIHLLPAEELQLLSSAHQASSSNYPSLSILELFAQQVKNTPDRIALAFGEETLSYHQLDQRANQLAHYLQQQGIQQGERVAILAERSPNMIISLLGILKCGGVYVPLHMDYPKARLEYILKDANISLVVGSHQHLQNKTQLNNIRFIAVDEAKDQSTSSLSVKMQEDAPIYVMYTSGTTGQPKGVLITQQNILKLVHEPGPIRILPTDRVLQWSNFAFDGSVYEIFNTLLTGATLQLIKEEEAIDPIALTRVIAQESISVCFMTTALFNALADHQPEKLKDLRKFLFGGEKFSLEHVKKMRAILGEGKVIHVYGPTETTVYATYYPVDEIHRDLVPIGFPLSNTQIYILNKKLELVPFGEEGEIYIGGKNVAAGYLNQEELTQEKFIEHFFPNALSTKLYKSGDIGRWLPNGGLDFIRRADDQVKIRGYRIELEEIESIIRQSSEVNEVLVVLNEEHAGNKRLLAYLTPHEDFKREHLLAHLHDVLPAYMVPSHIVVMEQFPLNQNGKIDKKALPAPDDQSLSKQAYVGAENEIQQQLIQIWEAVLRVDQIGIYDNFFELGGHSLLATRVLSGIRKALNVEVEVKSIFKHPTIASLSAFIKTQDQQTQVSISRADRSQNIPLSFGQESLWFIDKLQGSTQYHMPIAVRLEGLLNEELLQEAFRTIINRHEVLRTTYQEQANGEPIQVILPENQWSLGAIQQLAAGTSIQEWVEQQISQPFDLSKDHLLRIHLLKEHEQAHVMVMIMHHIACDGWSIPILIDELSERYAAGLENRKANLFSFDIQYADFSMWQRNRLTGDLLETKLQYWENQLKDLSPLNFPTDFPRPATLSNKGADETYLINPELYQQLKQLSRKEETSLFMTLFAAFQVMVYRYSGQEDLCISSPTASRIHTEIEPLIGFFINALPLRTDLSRDPSYQTLLQQVKEITLSAYNYQDVPFERIVDRVVTKREASRKPLSQDIIFVVQNNDQIPDVRLKGLAIAPVSFEQKTAQCDIHFSITELPEGLEIILTYATDLYRPTTIQQMIKHYEQILLAIVENPKASISQLSMLTPAETKLLIDNFSHTSSIAPAKASVIDLFEEQAAKHPKQTAIIFEDHTLTYQELKEQSDQLAVYLRDQHQVKAEDLIGVMMERSEWAIISFLGILKAGAAYLPIDIEYPLDRKSYIINDTQPKLLIIQSESLFDVMEFGIEALSIDIQFEEIQDFKASASTSLPDISAEDLAYVIYTSGSTGRPKGVMIEHGGFSNLVQAQSRDFGIQPDSRSLQFASFSFDASCSEIFTTLCSGATLVIPRKKQLLSIEAINQLIQKHQIDILTLPPSYQPQIKESWSGIKTLISAGEPLNKEIAQQMMAAGVRVLNAYGPTENTVCVSMTDQPITSDGQVTIGRPIEQVEVFILDARQNLSPIGIHGEIYIGGPQVARGYLNAPALNEQKFIPHPFSDKTGARLYRSGDLGRWLPDGNLEFLGRVDDQVKVRGHRIELGEIESQLREHPELKDAVVTVNQKEEEQELLAYYLLRDKIELWPSIAEFFIYDDIVYRSMYTHLSRNEKYKAAISKVAKGKVILEIGPGPEAVLSRLCLDCGAAHVYAVEILEETYQKAKNCIIRLGLSDKITLIHGSILDVELPVQPDYCVSEIVGSIGGSEGSAVLIEAAKKLIKNPANMIPSRSLTKIAAITLPEKEFEYAFSDVAMHYVNKIKTDVGENFEFRLCLKNLPKENIISSFDAFEDLDYTQPIDAEHVHDAVLEITKDATFNGFYVWMDLFMAPEIHLDILEDSGSWLPIYFPLAYPGHKVREGDRIQLTITRSLASNRINPDFFIKGQLIREGQATVELQFDSYHNKTVVSDNYFYKKLLNNGRPKALKKLSANLLKNDLAKFLPAYMLPNRYIELQQFPLTIAGKVDKKALPQPGQIGKTKEELVLPSSSSEKKVSEIWQKLLKANTIGIQQDFFELGGHSLLATRVVSMLRAEVNIEIEVKDIFNHPTVEKLAAFIDQQEVQEPMEKISAVENRPSHIPLSFAQERLWFIHKLQGSTAYHIPGVLRLKGVVDEKILEEVFQSIINRHEILRTVYWEEEGVAYQKVLPAGQWKLDIREVTTQDIDQWKAKALLEPFDLSADHMLRASLLKQKDSDEEYILTLVIHHIAADGWSLPILVREFIEFYEAKKVNRAAQLEVLPIQYADYAIWQKQYLSEQRLEKQLNYWEQQLKGITKLELPTDRPRSLQTSNQGQRFYYNINQELAAQLKQLSNEQGTTLFMTLLAVFKVLLFRYTQQEDICVGSGLANRTRTEIEPLIGFFINPPALRSKPSGNLTFVEYLQQIKQITLDAYQHQEVPFEKVVERVLHVREVIQNPLFQVAFILQNNDEADELKVGDFQLSQEEIKQLATTFDLKFDLQEVEAGLELAIEYRTDLFDVSTIDSMSVHYQNLIHAIVEQPNLPLNHFAMLTEEEEQQLVLDFNANKVNHPTDQAITALFTDQALQTPEHPALRFGETSMTYKELDQRSNQFAHYLKDRGVDHESLVALCIDRSFEMVIAILGILKAGGTYVPIDPAHPPHRINYLLRDTQAPYIVTQSTYNAIFNNLDEQVQCLAIDTLQSIWSSYSTAPLSSPVKAEQMAYVIYTSGSTGQPKGVMIQHRGLVNLVLAQIKAFQLSPDSKVLQFASISFDASCSEIFTTLISGAELVLAKKEQLLSPYLTGKLIEKHQITVLTLPPSYQSQVKENLRSVKTLVSAGEALDLPTAKYLKHNGVRILNAYGPTENTVCVSIAEDPIYTDQKVSIGRPIDNVEVYILDHHHNLLPIGSKGQIYVGGAQVAKGYLNNPSLTEEKFIEHPFSTNPTARLYATGDIGAWLPDGQIEFFGRQDDQVKIRGHRIELGEIENTINHLTAINQNCVLAFDDPIGGKTLSSYFVPTSAALAVKEEVLSFDQVNNWKDLYDQEYTPNTQEMEVEFDTTGWIDSLTGLVIPKNQMQEWQADIIHLIRRQSPRRVLEIGCGTGLIYYPLTSHIERYIGNDLSKLCITRIKNQVAKQGKDFPETSLLNCPAHQIELDKGEEIDTVILNSVIQYFPGKQYLSSILEKSLSALKSEGQIIIGDVRHQGLQDLFKSRLSLDKLPEQFSIEDFQLYVEREVLNDNELCVSPAFFYALAHQHPEITAVDIYLKEGIYPTEMNLYRYNVILKVGSQSTPQHGQWETWKEEAVDNWLQQLEATTKVLTIKDFPNPLLWKEGLLAAAKQNSTIRTVGDLKKIVDQPRPTNTIADQFIAQAKAKGFEVRMMVNKNPLLVNLILKPSGKEYSIKNDYPLDTHANEDLSAPLFYQSCLLIQKEIREQLKGLLPEYMIPAKFVALKTIPVNNSGKVNRKILQAWKDDFRDKTHYIAPANETEQALVAIWEELLRLDQISTHENFFELGGHSLLATRVISAIRRELKTEIEVKDLFNYPTIATLSIFILKQKNKVALLPEIKSTKRPEQIPLSYSQERLWFIDKLQGSLAYHMPAAIRISGTIDPQKLEAAFRTIIERHEVIRTVYQEENGEVYQQVLPSQEWNLSVTKSSATTNEDTLKVLTKAILEPFHLSKDYALRVQLIQESDQESILLLVMHHIASDGWSMPILINEFIHYYSSPDHSLSPLPIQYVDYAIWQRQYLSGEILESKLQYWSNQLSGVLPLDLPTDYLRPVVQDFEGARIRFELNNTLRNQLRDLSYREETTLFMVLLSAFKILMHKYTGQEDICVGSPIANRTQAETEPLIGFFVNTLALRSQVKEKANFRQLLQEVKATTLNAYTHQDVPFEKVVERVEQKRDLSRNPLFQVMMILQNNEDLQELKLDQLELSPEPLQFKTTKFDLTFDIKETDHGLSYFIEYSTALFQQETIERMSTHFEQLISNILDHPEKPIAELSLLPQQERLQLLNEFNQTAASYPQEESLTSLFQQQVEQRPDQVAVIDEQGAYTYQELDEKSNQFCHYLQQRFKLQAGELAGLKIENSRWTSVAILAILKAQAAYLPIDNENPDNRVQYILEDSDCKFLIDEQQIQDFAAKADQYAITAPPRVETAASLMAILYTSGSTSVPKGVKVTQSGLLNRLHWMWNAYPFEAHEVCCAKTSIGFTDHLWEVFGPLLRGIPLVVFRKEQLLNIDAFIDALYRYQVSRIVLVPSLLREILIRGAVSQTKLQKLKYWTCSGEVLPIDLANDFHQLFDQQILFNIYGSTEVTADATAFDCTALFHSSGDRNPKQANPKRQNVPIGRPISNTQIYVLDNHKNLVPIGVPGEIYVSGHGVSPGYLNHPELNKEKFSSNPFSDNPNHSLFKTGDLARWRPDGNLEYLGRKDQQVKIRAYRINPAEIEAILQKSGLVKQSCVIAREHRADSAFLIAYIVGEGSTKVEEVKAYLKTRLPFYMIPSFFIEMDQLPLLINGKINQSLLPDPDFSLLINQNYVAPRNEIETQLAEIWKTILELDKVGIHDNFFEIGGHSLLATRVISAIKEAFNITIPVKAIFQQNTIADLYKYIRVIKNLENKSSLKDVDVSYL